MERFSSWHRLLGVTAWIFRFISKSKRARLQKSQETGHKRNDSLEVLEPEEISNAKVLGSRNPKGTHFGGIDNLERSRKCLEKPSAVEIVALCGQ